jgi:hypothetical protein
MSVDPAALALGCNHAAGCPPAAWPINIARENFLLLKTHLFHVRVRHARTAAAGRTTSGKQLSLGMWFA